MFRSSQVLTLLLLNFFLWAPFTTVAHNRPVLDINGNKLQSGVDYHVISSIWGGIAGGLSLTSHQGTSSVYVMQHGMDSNEGKRLRFTPASSTIDGIIRMPLPRSWSSGERMIGETLARQSIIRESSDLNIQFSRRPSVWQLGKANESGMRYVKIGGKAGHPSRSTINNWFKIEEAGPGMHAYKIAYCPSVCGSCKTACGDLGISEQNGTRYLSLSADGPLVVIFRRVENH